MVGDSSCGQRQNWDLILNTKLFVGLIYFFQKYKELIMLKKEKKEVESQLKHITNVTLLMTR
jgi:hypothetical protein